MPQRHLSSVTSEAPRGDASVPASPRPAAPPRARDTLETSWIDEWGLGPDAPFPEAWSARLKASVSSAAARGEAPAVAISGVPEAWSVGPAASIIGVRGAGQETTLDAALEAWGLGPDLVTAYALIPATRRRFAAASVADVAGAGARDGSPAGAETRRRGG
ncbi:hypothetical protein [Corallococcus macrosporus]|uniref:Uncharacterized protein n=1 Tax=Corallococcus macrosporus DSM 14697 TaxID=1189310 RepID=A0A250K3H1_9BACT|nr:hypothetical protein [Corallococcus macrosporus]ATB50440.1 hypothetical protein MYMAC_006096 [Corallococcus macrosporus DSM 14697]